MSENATALEFMPLSIAVLTVSDTRSLTEDRSGNVLQDRIIAAGHLLSARTIVRDEVEDIRKQVRSWIADPEIQVIITTGGTGLTGRDITPEAIAPLLEKTMDGFSVLFHRISYESVGTCTVQSRTTAGVANATYIFVLPGSPGACKDAWDGILERQLDARHRPSNFVELLPRLNEHRK